MFNHVFSYCWKQFQGSIFVSILWICFLGDTTPITYILAFLPICCIGYFLLILLHYVIWLTLHILALQTPFCVFAASMFPVILSISFSLPAALIFFFYLSSRFRQLTFCSLCCLAVLLHLFTLIFVLWFHGIVFCFCFLHLRENIKFSPSHG